MEKLLLVFSLSVIVGQAYSCCMPQKLEGQIGMSIGLKNNGTPLAMTAFYDKWAMDTSIGRGYLSGTIYYGRYPTHQEVFQDINLGKQYELSYGRCTVSPLLFDIKPVGGKYCMPPSDKIMASYKGLPNDTVDFDMYLIQFPGGQMTMSLTTKDCAPLSESIHTTEGVFNMGFMGLTEGITDPSVFEMPQACKDLQPSRKKREVGKVPFIPSI
ncbi:unnamed protein product [Mytilus edulis]|uniref:Uncharacterized protein n=1 Tax=Mytilus edulis TaxID=6550 RepID=A0A8S3PZU1_MYTED|nr:unnamed protein product [Mytilus edulis]